MIIFTRILLVVIAVTTVFSANAEARFLSPDPIRVVDQNGKINQVILANPQRLNQYVYGLNNPYRYVDPDGEFVFAAVPLFASGAWALDAM